MLWLLNALLSKVKEPVTPAFPCQVYVIGVADAAAVNATRAMPNASLTAL